MTLNQAADAVFAFSKNHVFSGKKYTQNSWRKYMNEMMKEPDKLPVPNTLLSTILLPNGEWFFTISFFPESVEYGWYIPETREQERKLKEGYGIKDDLDELLLISLQDPEFKKAWEESENEWNNLRAIYDAREQAGTQKKHI